jgi:hypothetical protein
MPKVVDHRARDWWISSKWRMGHSAVWKHSASQSPKSLALAILTRRNQHFYASHSGSKRGTSSFTFGTFKHSSKFHPRPMVHNQLLFANGFTKQRHVVVFKLEATAHVITWLQSLSRQVSRWWDAHWLLIPSFRHSPFIEAFHEASSGISVASVGRSHIVVLSCYVSSGCRSSHIIHLASYIVYDTFIFHSCTQVLRFAWLYTLPLGVGWWPYIVAWSLIETPLHTLI